MSLFRLFDEFHRRGANSHIIPRFDVCEFSDAYELHGELPGIDKKDLQIEFADAQTLLLHGVFRRSYKLDTPLKEPRISDQSYNDTSMAKHERNEQQDSGTKTQNRSSSKQGIEELDKKNKRNEPKFWATERVFGEFSRPFTFVNKIYHNGVTAELKDGILTVRVPKTGDSSPHKIEIV